jgi:hypothetical protein
MILNPSELTQATNRGEEILRNILKISFHNKNYVAIHSLGLSEHSTKPYAEADFVLITDFGIFCLEVKGGKISRQDGVWKIGYPEENKYYESSEGPFKQASGTVAPVLKKLKNNDPIKTRKFNIFWGVVFPNDIFNIDDPEWNKDQVCDLTKINNFETFLINLGEFTNKHFSERRIKSEGNINFEDIKWASHVLRRDIAFNNFKANEIINSNRELIELEKDQVAVLDDFIIGSERRMILSGGAGTGKTLLCNKIVEELSSHDKKVLYICFNRALSLNLKNIFNSYEKLTVGTLHSFMESIVGSERISNLPRNNEYFERDLPDLFKEVVLETIENEQIDNKFDALIIDESQDILTEDIMVYLFQLLKGGFENGIWFLSVDEDIQSEIYSRFERETLDKIIRNGNCVTRKLYRNLRNPLKIAEKANSLFPDLQLPKPSRDFNSFLKKISYVQFNEEIEKLKNKVADLLNNGVLPSSITILTFSSKNNSFLNQITHIENIPLRNSERSESNDLKWFEIGSYKGLENDIIIIVEAPKTALDNKQLANYYVALTRTKTECYIFFKKNTEIGGI